MDSENIWNAFIGSSGKGRSTLVDQGGALTIINENWKHIPPINSAANTDPSPTNIETGNLPKRSY